MTDNFYTTADYPNATNGYDIYDTNYTYTYDESYFTSYQNISPTTNVNGTYDPNEFVLPWWRQILWSILFGGMVIVSTVGNLIVIWIVLAHKRMRTPTNYFLVNLSIADAMVSTLNVTFSFTYMLNSHWPFGTLYCKISQFVAILSIGASVFTLMAIAIDRNHRKIFDLGISVNAGKLFMWKMKRFNHTKWMILLIGIYCAHESCADSNTKALNSNETKAIKLEFTDNDGRVVVKEVRGEEMACIMKCFPANEKRCRTKSTPEEENILNTTPIPPEVLETSDTTGAKMSTMSFRSATSLSKLEQAVSAEAATEVPHSTKEEDKNGAGHGKHSLTASTPTITTNRPTTGSVANDRPTSSTFETISDTRAQQLDPNSDYSLVAPVLDLDSLDLVTTLEIENQHSSPATRPPELNLQMPKSETTKFPFDPYVDSGLRNHNLRRHSHEDYDIDCDPTELESVDRFAPSTASINSETFSDKLDIPLEIDLNSLAPTRKPIVASPDQTSTIGESMRRMSESEEISTECDSVEDLLPRPTFSVNSRPMIPVSTAPPPSQLTATITRAPADTSVNKELHSVTDSMRRMSASEETETDCEFAEVDTSLYQHATEPPSTQIMSTSKTNNQPQTQATDAFSVTDTLTSPQSNALTVNELSRRMSDVDVDCKHSKSDNGNSDDLPNTNNENSITMSPIVDSMRRMSNSNENSADCDSQETIVELTTAAPIISDSMRRMSHLDKFTTELNSEYPTNPTIVYDSATEYVTECDTLSLEAEETAHSQDPLNDAKETDNNSLHCCPDSICSLLYPSVPNCNGKMVAASVDEISDFIRKIDDLRDMFYLHQTQVLITKMVGDIVFIKKRMDYERHLVASWNDTLSVSQVNIANGCANDSKNAEQIISSIHCFLTFTDNLIHNSFLELILDVVKRIETVFPGNKVLRYSKLRRIILQSIPNVVTESYELTLLSDYMRHNRNYENERIILLQLLLDIQERFETHLDNYLLNQKAIKPTDSSKSLQENGLGIKMHRTLH